MANPMTARFKSHEDINEEEVFRIISARLFGSSTVREIIIALKEKYPERFI